VARLVDLWGGGCDAVAVEVLPAQAAVGEDADQAAGLTAHRDGLVVAIVAEAGATAVNAISNASGSSMLSRASAASIWPTVALASRSARLRADASRFTYAFGPDWVMMGFKVSSVRHEVRCCIARAAGRDWGNVPGPDGLPVSREGGGD